MPGPLDALLAAGTLYVQKRTTDKQVRAASKAALPPAPATSLTVEVPNLGGPSRVPSWLLPVGIGAAVLALGVFLWRR